MPHGSSSYANPSYPLFVTRGRMEIREIRDHEDVAEEGAEQERSKTRCCRVPGGGAVSKTLARVGDDEYGECCEIEITGNPVIIPRFLSFVLSSIAIAISSWGWGGLLNNERASSSSELRCIYWCATDRPGCELGPGGHEGQVVQMQCIIELRDGHWMNELRVG